MSAAARWSVARQTVTASWVGGLVAACVGCGSGATAIDNRPLRMGESPYSSDGWRKASRPPAPTGEAEPGADVAGESEPQRGQAHAELRAGPTFGPSRDSWQKPDELLAALNLKPAAVVADVGADDGYFTLRVARVAAQGRVYAVDADAQALQRIARDAQLAGLGNVVPIRPQGNSLGIPEPVDFALAVGALSRVEHPRSLLGAVAAALRPGGRALFIDWAPGALPVGPSERVAQAEMEGLMLQVGFAKVSCSAKALPYQWLCVAAR